MNGNKLYNDLNVSAEVQHTAKGTKNKVEAIKRYMDRLETTHSKAINSTRKSDIDKLKALYHKKYVVKEKEIPKYRDKEKIINAQKESLDKWLNYLLDENTKYPMWAKYWVFQGMLNIGTYDESNNVYLKRSKKTLASFIEANPEIIAKCIGVVIDFVGKKEINDKELEQLVAEVNFTKLYTLFLKQKKEQIQHESEKEDGIWIIYQHESKEEAEQKEQNGIEPEYLKLYNSLQGFNTGWCTAGYKEIAKNQICGGGEYLGGDFYVYYTKDKNDEYKVPRIAIRMEDDDIGEIRGIDDGQNIEEGFEVIIEKKLKEMKNISEEQRIKNLKAIENSKKLTLLNRKTNTKETLTTEEIEFIWEVKEKISGFGWNEDKRIKKIIERRDAQKDYDSLINKENKLGFITSARKHEKNIIIRESDIALKAVQQEGLTLEYVDTNIEGYKEIATLAVEQNGMALKYIPSNIEGYKEIATLAVQQEGLALEYVSTNIEEYSKIAASAVQQNSLALGFVPTNIKEYREIAASAVQQNGTTLRFVPTNIEGYSKIATLAVQQNGMALKYVPSNIEGYREIALEAVKNSGHAIRFVPSNIEGYSKIALSAVQHNGLALKYINENTEGYKEIILEAVKEDEIALNYINKNYKKNHSKEYEEIIKQAGEIIKEQYEKKSPHNMR